MKTIIELREEAIEKDINPECYLYQKLEKQKEVLDKIKEYMKTLSDEYAADNYDIKYDVFNKIYDLLEEID